MSNFLSIATVTASLAEMLQVGLSADLTDVGIAVTAARPEAGAPNATEARGYVFLYQITPNGSLRNADQPARSRAGRLVNRPRAALDLHYLLSFQGDEAKLVPQRMLGSTIRHLNTQPQLTRNQITNTISTRDFLASSDLGDEIETVRFTLATLTLDELSKIWSIFYQTPYELSIAYIASVAYIEGTESGRAAPPVQRSNIYAIPSLGPHIDQLLSQATPTGPIVAEQFVLPGYRLIVRGERLRGDITRVSIGGTEVTPTPDQFSAGQIAVGLPGSLRPGLQSVQVLQPFNIGNPPVEHRGLESNVVPLILHPKVTATATVTATRVVNGVTLNSGTVKVAFTPRIGLRQRVALELNEFNAPTGQTARAYTFSPHLPHPPNPAGAGDTDTLDIDFTDVVAGTYLVRVRVDGAESPLATDSEGRYNGPQVTI